MNKDLPINQLAEQLQKYLAFMNSLDLDHLDFILAAVFFTLSVFS